MAVRLGPEDITEPALNLKNARVISLQTVKGTEASVLKAEAFEIEANQRREERDISPFLDLCSSR